MAQSRLPVALLAEVLRISGKWQCSKQVATGLLLEFERKGQIQTSLALEASERNAWFSMADAAAAAPVLGSEACRPTDLHGDNGGW